jgi:hypothetical protein
VISAVQFLATVQPTVPFWDPGELSAAAYLLQVPHPPGGPLFSLIGRIFYILPIPGNLGLKVNLVSVCASIATVFFLYLIAVKLIENLRGGPTTSITGELGTYLSAAIGALALSFCDSFWFNGVESNYFATSTLLFSMMVWLMLKWNEKADQPTSDRYLLMIAYLAGLSAGVHLMSVPAIFAAVMIVVFRRYTKNKESCKKSTYVFLFHIAVLLLVTYGMWSSLKSVQPPSIEDAKAYDQRFVGIMGITSLGVMGLFWKQVFRRDSIYLALLVAGIALGIAYPGVIKLLPQLIHLLSADDSTMGGLILLAVVAVFAALAFWARRRKHTLVHLFAVGVLLMILGFSTYTMILIRANKHTPMNENEPRTFSGLLTYLNREQYGDFPIFKRRWSPEVDRQRTFREYTSDFDFFWRYQMHHMFTRYLLFNYVGRTSRDQDDDWSAAQLFGIPLLIGLFGLYTHLRRNWQMATVFLILFVIVGYLIAFYQNQQEPQPRERDYFYGGAYFVFAVWIALGMNGLIELVRNNSRASRLASIGMAAVVLLGAVFIPFRMAWTNWHTHDRSKNWLAWETGYNMLQTCDKDGILITNGDNDTFPLWYLQDVEGIRRDVRVVCLSLANTNWYVQQLKNPPYFPEAKAVPLSISDSRIATIQPALWEPQIVTVPVPKEVYAACGITDTAITNKGKIEWRMQNTLEFGNTKAVRVQDIVVLDIIRTNQWKRPIYFAVTGAPDSRIGLDEYLKICGFAYRLTPAKATPHDVGVDEPRLADNLMHEPEGYSQKPQYGFKLRTIADTTVFFDENENRILFGLRLAFRSLTYYYLEGQHDPQKAALVVDRLQQIMPPSRMVAPIEESVNFATIYFRIGQLQEFNAIADRVEQQFAGMSPQSLAADPYVYGAMLELYEIRRDYPKALSLLQKLARMYPDDPSIKARINSMQEQLKKAGG